MLFIGLDRDNWALILRPWRRLGENGSEDDNPDIGDYLGRGDILLVHTLDRHQFSLTARHSLHGGRRSHGALQFDWAFPIRGQLRGRFQIFHGYGESMIDYNHKATWVSLGLSLREWF
jgi:phospholipase A1